MNNTGELVKTTKKLFSINLIIVIYILLTILSITDVHLILNEVVRLPIFNLEINLVTFFILAPITLLILFVYFIIHFNKTLVYCKAEYPDTNSWLILETFLPREYEKDNKSKLLNLLEIVIGYFAIWWILPIANLVILYRFVYTHEGFLILIIGSITTLTNLLLLYAFYEIILKPSNKLWELLSKLWFTLVIGGIYFIVYQPYLKTTLDNENIGAIVIFLSIVIIGFLIEGVIYALSKNEKKYVRIFQTIWLFILLTPMLASLHYSLFAEVGERKNVNLNVQVLNDNVVTKIDLRNKKLDGANLVGATIINALLRNVDLREASLADANLDGSDFENALLEGADLRRASLLNVKNLTFNQLNSVKTLYGAKFDSTMDSIISKLNEDNPTLFDEPNN